MSIGSDLGVALRAGLYAPPAAASEAPAGLRRSVTIPDAKRGGGEHLGDRPGSPGPRGGRCRSAGIRLMESYPRRRPRPCPHDKAGTGIS